MAVREITRDGVIVIDDEDLTGADVIEILKSRDTYLGWKREGDKRIADLEQAIRVMHAVIPGGSSCDPQEIADDIRNIARQIGVTIPD